MTHRIYNAERRDELNGIGDRPNESRRRGWWLAALVVVTAVVMGAPTLKGTFVGGDDHRLVLDHVLVNHPSLGHAAKLFTILHRDLYQPLPLLSFSAEFAVAIPLGLFDQSIKGGAWLFHLTNVLLHAVNALLVFQLIRRFGSKDGDTSASNDRAHLRELLDSARSRRLKPAARERRGIAHGGVAAAAVAGVIFAVHPLNVEVVAWINGRMMLLSTLFALAALIAFDRWVAGASGSRDSSAPTGGGRYRKGDRGADGVRTAATGGGRYVARGGRGNSREAVAGGGQVWAWLTVLFVACSGMSKIRVSLPLLMLIIPIVQRRRHAGPTHGSQSRGTRGRITVRFVVVWVASTAITAVLAVVNYVATSRSGLFSGAEENLHGPTIVRGLRGLAWYFEHLVWPTGLASWYPTPTTVCWSDAETLRAAAVVASVLLMAAWAARRSRVVLLGFGWFFVSIASTLQLFPSRNVLAADRYMYLPMIGLLWVVGVALTALVRAAARWATTTTAVAAGPIAFVAIAAMVATSWHVASFYETPLKKSERIAHLNPTTPRVWERLAWAYHRVDRHADAIESARKELVHDDGMVRSEAYQVIGTAQLALGEEEEALRNLRQAVAEDPVSPEAPYHLARALEKLGRFEEALPLYEETVAKAPLANPRIFRLAGMYRAMGRNDDARAMYLRMLANNPYDPKATMALTELDIERGGADDLQAAERRLLTLLDWMPENADAWVNVGVVRHMQGRTDGAIEAYGRALSENPQHAVAALNLALIYVQRGDVRSAAVLFERAAASGLPSVEQVAQVHDFFVAQGQVLRAVRLWEDFVQRFPDSADGPAFLIWSRAIAGEMGEAESNHPLAMAARVYVALLAEDYESAVDHAEGLAATEALGADARARLRRALGEIVMKTPAVPWTYCIAARLWQADGEVDPARGFIDLCERNCADDACRRYVAALRTRSAG